MLGDGAIHGRPSSGQLILRFQPLTRKTSSLSSGQPRRLPSSRRISPRVRPWRTGRSRAPTKEAKPFADRVAFVDQAAERVGAVEQPHLEPGRDRRFGGENRGGGEGVVAGADVLEVDQQHLEARGRPRGSGRGWPRRRRRARRSARPEGDPSRRRWPPCPARPRSSRARGRKRGRLAGRRRGERQVGGPQVPGDRGRVAEQAVAPAGEPRRLGEQPVDAAENHVVSSSRR